MSGLLTLLLFLGCTGAGEDPRASAAKVLGIDPPSYLQEISFLSEPALSGLSICMRAELPPNKVEAFLSTSERFPPTVTDTDAPVAFANYCRHEDWWRPTTWRSPTYGEQQGRRGRWRTQSYVAVVKQDATVSEVYLLYFEEP